MSPSFSCCCCCCFHPLPWAAHSAGADTHFNFAYNSSPDPILSRRVLCAHLSICMCLGVSILVDRRAQPQHGPPHRRPSLLKPTSPALSRNASFLVAFLPYMGVAVPSSKDVSPQACVCSCGRDGCHGCSRRNFTFAPLRFLSILLLMIPLLYPLCACFVRAHAAWFREWCCRPLVVSPPIASSPLPLRSCRSYPHSPHITHVRYTSVSRNKEGTVSVGVLLSVSPSYKAHMHQTLHACAPKLIRSR